MRQKLIFILILFASLNSFGQEKSAKEFTGKKCLESWQYFHLKSTITGKVIFHKKAISECGDIGSASVTLIQTANLDTIRVLELCNTTKDFAIGQLVIVTPFRLPNDIATISSIPFIGTDDTNVYSDPFECNLKRTSFGTIKITSK